jgi:hypothetical protein
MRQNAIYLDIKIQELVHTQEIKIHIAYVRTFLSGLLSIWFCQI